MRSFVTESSPGRCIGNNGPIECLHALAIENCIASGGWDHIIRVWNVESRDLKASLAGHNAWVVSIHNAPDTNRLLSSSDDGTIIEWDLETGRKLSCLFKSDTMLKSVRCSPNGQYIAVAGWNGSLWLLDRTGALVWSNDNAHSDSIWRVDFSPKGKHIATAGNDGIIRIWSTITGDLESELVGSTTSVESVQFSPNGDRIYSVGFDGMRTWDLASTGILWHIDTKADHLLDISVSSDGLLIATCGTEHILTIRHPHGDVIWNSEPENDNLVAATFDKSSNWIAAAGDDGDILVWYLNDVSNDGLQ